MPDLKISQLPAATTPLAGTELVPIVQSGTTDKVTVADLTAGRAVSASALTASSGNLTFSGTAQRITGDMSNATVANRLMFQTSTTNGSTTVSAIPNGTSTTAAFGVFNSSDTANASIFNILATSTEVSLRNPITGTGTYLPMTFQTSGSERVRIDTSGNVGIGTASPASRLDVSGSGTQTVRSATVDTSGTAIGRFRAVYTGGGGGAASAVDLRAGDGYTYLLTETNSPLLFGTNAAERMRIDSSGNVGINGTPTTSTTSRFFLGGDATLAGGSRALLFNMYYHTTNSRWEYAANAPAFGWVDIGSGNMAFLSTGSTSGAAGTGASPSERFRFDSLGNVVQGTAALATNATAGFLWITSCAGAPTGAPTAPYTNAAALVCDTTNNRLYVRVGSTWRYATLT